MELHLSSTSHKVAVPCCILQILLPMGEMMYYCTVTLLSGIFRCCWHSAQSAQMTIVRLVYHSSSLQFDLASIFRNFHSSIFFYLHVNGSVILFIHHSRLIGSGTDQHLPGTLAGTLAGYPGPLFPSKKTPCPPHQLHHISSLLLQLFLNVSLYFMGIRCVNYADSERRGVILVS